MKLFFFISIFILISNCSFNLVDDHHGVFYLEKKEKKIEVQVSNTNDILSILGEPSTKSTFDNDVWIYIERKITNSHFFGRRELVVNNVMILEIDDKGVLAKKDFFDINDMKDIDFDQKRSESLQKRNFIYNFLSSLRQRVNDPLGVRKKKRQQGTR
ncbi:outer membrane protein assembly factor BamE [Candidatus Pelagibacter sp.]|nr:outer membrane protein assembly factor BamE [Candidatus Pelagibacter sp.]